MIWLIIAVASYFFNAVVATVDKFILSGNRSQGNPYVYAFYTGILNAVVLVLWPFDFSFLPLKIILVAFSSGAAFVLALFFFYSAMAKGEVSRVVSSVGGISPIVLFVLSYFLLDERLPAFWILGLAVLVSGSFIITFEQKGRVPLYSFIAAIFFALSFFAAKEVFVETSFLNGFIWSRIGALILVAVAFCVPRIRSLLKFNPEGLSGVPRRLLPLFISNKALGGLCFLGINYAIMLGSVAVVNALQGIQFVFIFCLALLFSVYFPGFLKESFSFKATMQKIVGIVLISLGVAILFIA